MIQKISIQNVLFFSHNKRHYNFFYKVTEKINIDKSLNINIRQLTDSEFIPNKKNENTNLRIILETKKINNVNKEINRIRDEYPDFDLLAALIGDRDLNFFQRYLKILKITRAMQELYLVAAFRVFETDLKSKPVDLIISELVLGLQDAVLCAVAKRNKIAYVGLRASKLGKGVIFCDPYTEIPFGFEKTLKSFSFQNKNIPEDNLNFALEHINQLRIKYSMPVYMKETGKNASYLERHLIKRFLEVLFSIFKYQIAPPFYRINIFDLIRYRLIRMKNIWQLRGKKGKRLFASISELKDKKYIIFPLQYEPEATTLVRSYPYTDQISFAKHLSKILPDNVYLAVKEHRGNEGYRQIKDYQDLYYEPNIILLPRVMDVSDLIKKSSGVVTLTGRMGWEALVLNKPAFIVGRAFWSKFVGARKLKDLENLKAELNKTVSHKNDELYTEDQLYEYASAYHAHTYRGIFLGKSPMLMENENIAEISESICLFISARDYT
jgi:hypothetical protein